jgi:hypothetical protein
MISEAQVDLEGLAWGVKAGCSFRTVADHKAAKHSWKSVSEGTTSLDSPGKAFKIDLSLSCRKIHLLSVADPQTSLCW